MPQNARVIEITPAAPSPPQQGPPKRKRPKNEAPSYLTEDEIGRLFHVITSVRDRAMFRIAYHAGLRASEVGMLQLRDWNGKMDRMFAHRLKGSNSGEHGCTRETAKAMRAWLKARGGQSGTLFPSQKGSPISRQMLDVLMRKYAAAAGIPKELRHFHVLKHSCATHLLTKGYNIEMVQNWLGHADIKSTQVYAKVTNPRRDEMAAQLRDTWK